MNTFNELQGDIRDAFLAGYYQERVIYFGLTTSLRRKELAKLKFDPFFVEIYDEAQQLASIIHKLEYPLASFHQTTSYLSADKNQYFTLSEDGSISYVISPLPSSLVKLKNELEELFKTYVTIAKKINQAHGEIVRTVSFGKIKAVHELGLIHEPVLVGETAMTITNSFTTRMDALMMSKLT